MDKKIKKAWAVVRTKWGKKIPSGDPTKYSFLCISKSKYYLKKWILKWVNKDDFKIVRVEIKIIK